MARIFYRLLWWHRGGTDTKINSQHKKLTMEKKIILPFLPGLKPVTFQSQVNALPLSHPHFPATCFFYAQSTRNVIAGQVCKIRWDITYLRKMTQRDVGQTSRGTSAFSKIAPVIVLDMFQTGVTPILRKWQWFIKTSHLLGDSGGVVNSLDFCPASLKSLGYFYFRCVLSSEWKAVTVNLWILHCQH